ncbi:hypothetical protein JVU11DRAFT_6701 [Chiua virens]|nr:hypothetical protein JVU11DRAFT_6701 [Chiua virens]
MAAMFASTWGNPNAPKRVLMLHGVTGSSTAWYLVAPEFASRGKSHLNTPGVLLKVDRRRLFCDRTRYARAWTSETGIGLYYCGDGKGAPAVFGALLKATITHMILSSDIPLELSSPLPFYHISMAPEPHAMFRKDFVENVTNVKSPEQHQKENPSWSRVETVVRSTNEYLCDAAAVAAILDQNLPWSFSHLLLTVPDNVKVTVLAADPSMDDRCVTEEDLKPYSHVIAKTAWGIIVTDPSRRRLELESKIGIGSHVVWSQPVGVSRIRRLGQVMSDGTRLRQAWSDALGAAENNFRQLLASYNSGDWKHVSLASDAPTSPKGKSRISLNPELTDVVVHRKAAKSGENVYRVVLDVPATDESALLDAWKAIIMTPELRQEWDPAVEGAHLVEMFDHRTRISKTQFTLGWPVNPRDAVTISRLHQDASTIIDITTSLPRSVDEPAYLRPSPPYVRSHVELFTWCIQYIQPSSVSTSPSDSLRKRLSSALPRLRISCFWQHDLRSVWNLGSTATVCQQLCTMILGLYKTVKKRGSKVPMLAGYGYGVGIDRVRFRLDRQALTVEYLVHLEEDTAEENVVHNLDELREHRRLVRSIEFLLPVSEGWDVQVTAKAPSERVEKLPWTATAIRGKPSTSPGGILKPLELTVFRVMHASLPDAHSVLKVCVVFELSGPSSGIRLNGLPQTIQVVEERDPGSLSAVQQQLLQDASSVADASFQTSSSVSSVGTIGSAGPQMRPRLVKEVGERSTAAEKSILSRVKRNYIYFSSLLQEPEAKWKRITEARGVSVTQLDSIDPTLVVYRAEATFVGLGLWDLYGALVSPGARAFWDKQYDDAVLLEDVNELTELWHFKTKPAWPVFGRDTVLLKTLYKSPTTIHVFLFSADDPYLFPSIPPPDPSFIRAQVDLQGWAIEALSPSTTQLTLLEQSDPKGWSNKASTIPTQMVGAVAGIGDFVIKCGGPPVVTRLAGARALEMRYDHEKSLFRVTYEASEGRRSGLNGANGASGTMAAPTTTATTTDVHAIECEMRCDLDTWASSLDIVVDPPPQSVTALRRHRLSSLAIVRRGPMSSTRDKGVVMVNGARVTVDVEELPESEIKALSKRKRIKPARVPLDQPPVVSAIRRRRAEWDADGGSLSDTTRDNAAVFQPAGELLVERCGTGDEHNTNPSLPMQHVAEALHWLRELQTQPEEGWTLVSDKGFSVKRKVFPDISSLIPVHKGEKVIEGVSAEEVLSIVTSYECRKTWDDRFASAIVLEQFGAKCHTAFITSKGGFPFRDRGFLVASMVARSKLPQPAGLDREVGVGNPGNESGSSQESRVVLFCGSASFHPESAASFSSSKYNPFVYPLGRIFVDGWVLETLDPYTTENYAIPSTRVTRVVAVDHAGSIPVAVNTMMNAGLARAVGAVEVYMKGASPLPMATGTTVEAAVSVAFGQSSAAWKVKKRDEQRTLIETRYDPVARAHTGSMLLTSTGSLGASLSSTKMDDSSPKTSKAISNSSGTVRDGRPSTLIEPISPPPSIATQRRTSSGSRRSLSTERNKPYSSSAFTVKGELRHSTDLVVAEVVVDTKLYPEGYDVAITSTVREGSKCITLPSSTDTIPSPTTNTTSPQHSSGLNADRPPRHLLRLMLPTAQYQISTVQDPLTGETRGALPKPQWYIDLQDKGFVVQTTIRPLGSASGVSRRVSVSDGNGAKKNGNVVARVDGVVVGVASEKESLTALGRDELQDDRVSRMLLLQRAADEEEAFPDELKIPLARADDMLDDDTAVTSTDDTSDSPKTEEKSSPQQEVTDKSPPPESPENGSATQPCSPNSTSGGLLGFLNAYPNPLARWTTSVKSPAQIRPPSLASSRRSSVTLPKVPGGLKDETRKSEAGSSATVATATNPSSPRMYPLSVILVVALIAFLIGSLLRSLLSPADFIYVVTDIKDAEEMSTGWREIRRLVEIKYIVGGWDFQIAVVRRH